MILFLKLWFGTGILMVLVAVIRNLMGKQGTDADALLGLGLILAGPVFLVGQLARQYRIKFPKK